MATVIDKLIVEVELAVKDSKSKAKELSDEIDNINKTQKKATEDQSKTEKKATQEQSKDKKKATEEQAKARKKNHKESLKESKELSKSFTDVSKEFVKYLIAFKSATGIKDYISDTVTSSASLQRLSSNLGTSITDMKKFGNAVYNVGGNSQEAINSIEGLISKITRLKVMGDTSSLPWLNFLGVSPATSTGERKDVNQLLDEIRSGLLKYKEPERKLIAEQIGIGPDLLYAMSKTDEEWRKLIADGEKQSNIMETLGPKTQRWMESWRRFSSEAHAEALDAINDSLENGVLKNTEKLMNLFEKGDFSKFISFENFGNMISSFKDSVMSGQYFDRLYGGEKKVQEISSNVESKASPYIETIKLAAKKHGVDPNILYGMLKTESGFKPNAINPQTGAAGIAQFMPDAAKRFGVNPMDPESSIFGMAKYVKTMLDMFGGDYQKAVAGYHAGEGTVQKASMYGMDWMSHLGPRTKDYANKVFSIGHVTVNTQATNATELARDLPGKIAAQAEGNQH